MFPSQTLHAVRALGLAAMLGLQRALPDNRPLHARGPADAPAFERRNRKTVEADENRANRLRNLARRPQKDAATVARDAALARLTNWERNQVSRCLGNKVRAATPDQIAAIVNAARARRYASGLLFSVGEGLTTAEVAHAA